jgi:pimeloyl-ACP methyl ester carboxylesterase
MPIDFQTLGDFRVRVWAEGSGSPLLYLHDFEQHPGGASFLQQLAADRRVYAPEHPGYGESTGFDAIDNLLDLVLFYRQLVASWEVGPLDVVGHGLGGMIAAEFAAICPQFVRRLVLISPYGLWNDAVQLPDPFALPPDRFRQAKWHDPEKAADAEPSIFEANGDDAFGDVLFRAQNLAVATQFLWPIADHGLDKRLPLIEAPVLLVQGESDGLVPASYAEEFAQRIPTAKVERIEAAGHLPMVEREDDFLRVVREFLA